MKLFFDILITLGITITALPAVMLLYSMKKRESSWEARNTRIAKILATILLIGTTLLIWGSFLEPKLIVINKKTIDVPNIDEEIRIAFIADFQLGRYKQNDWAQTVSEKIITLNPDIVLIGGDNVDNAIYNEKELSYLEPLELLAEKYPTYAVHGNHEYGIGGGKSITNPKYRVANVTEETKKMMESIGIRYLVNELEEIKIENQSFYLFGGDEFWSGNLNFDILKNKATNIPTIGLIHNPAFIRDEYPTDVDLYLSGHTHGGQIRFPILGPIGRVDNVIPAEYYQGLHDLDNNTQLFVTSGIGETGTRARLFNPPEIVLITLE